MVIGTNKKLSSPRPRTESVLGSGLYIQCPTSSPFTHMYDRRGCEMYYADEIQVDPRALLSLDLFRVDSECVFGVVVCLGHGNIKNDRQQTPFTQVQIMSSTEPKSRPIKLEAHVLAYLGDFMNVFEESIRRQALREIHTLPSKPTTGTQKPREPPPSSR